MPLETGTYLPDLNPSNPASTDGLGAGDDHLRFIKSTLKNTFPNFTDVALASTQTQLDAAVAVTAGTSVSTIPLGTAALPGLSVTGDTNTGIYSPGADQLSISVGGVQAVAVNADTSVNFAGPVAAAGALAVAGAYSGGTGQIIPSGMPLPWLTDTAPTGYLFLNGQAISRTTFAGLFSIFSTGFGAGDGTTTFNLPDFRDVTLVGKTTMGGTTARGLISHLTITALGAVVGEEQHTLTLNETATHSHTATVTDTGHTHAIIGVGGAVANGNQGGGGGNIAGAVINPVTTSSLTGISVTNSNQGGGLAHNNVQPSIVVNWIVKT